MKYIIVALFIIWGFVIMHSLYKIRSLETTLSSQNAELETRRNQAGELITEKQAGEIRIRDLERQIPKFKEQLQRDFDIKTRNLRGYAQTDFKAEGHGNAHVFLRIPYDTTLSFYSGGEISMDTMKSVLSIVADKLPHGPGYYYLVDQDTVKVMTDANGRPLFSSFTPFAIVVQDGYLDLQADVYSEIDAPYKYSYTDTLKYAFYMKRERWYKARKLYGAAMLSNPNARVTNTQSFLVQRDKRFGLGPYFGYGVGVSGAQTNIGISVHYSLIRF